MLSTDDLIERGYLPYEVIPPLNTKTLSQNLNKIMPQLNSFHHKSSKCCFYTIPKVKHIRRVLSIPNPLYQIRLCKALEDNWNNIKNHLEKSHLSKLEIYNPLFSENEDRAIYREMKLSDIPQQRALYSNNSRYLLKADLSRFFPTIYTHIITWALHTKPVAKTNLRNKTLNSLYGDSIDNAVRNTQDTQTLGIPIGPDSSLLISEIIATAVDDCLINKLLKSKIKYKGFRFVDDYYLYFNNLADAEFALSNLYSIVKHFELELNSDKTKIVELPDILDSRWVLELDELPLDNASRKTQSDNLISYFSRAFDLSKQYPEDSVLKYALNEIADVNIEEKYWPLYEALILKSILAEPAVLPTATEIFLAYEQARYPLDKKIIRETLYELITYNSNYSHSHELAWALWMCKSLKIRVIKEIANCISNVDDSVVALVALDLSSQGLIKTLDKSKWLSYMNQGELYSDHWLLAYEAAIKGWLRPSNQNYINNDNFFKLLKDNNVTFYNGTNQVVPTILSPTRSAESKERRRRKRGY